MLHVFPDLQPYLRAYVARAASTHRGQSMALATFMHQFWAHARVDAPHLCPASPITCSGREHELRRAGFWSSCPGVHVQLPPYAGRYIIHFRDTAPAFPATVADDDNVPEAEVINVDDEPSLYTQLYRARLPPRELFRTLVRAHVEHERQPARIMTMEAFMDSFWAHLQHIDSPMYVAAPHERAVREAWLPLETFWNKLRGLRVHTKKYPTVTLKWSKPQSAPKRHRSSVRVAPTVASVAAAEADAEAVVVQHKRPRHEEPRPPLVVTIKPPPLPAAEQTGPRMTLRQPTGEPALVLTSAATDWVPFLTSSSSSSGGVMVCFRYLPAAGAFMVRPVNGGAVTLNDARVNPLAGMFLVSNDLMVVPASAEGKDDMFLRVEITTCHE